MNESITIETYEPSYSQGFYDGMNTTLIYFTETEQLKDSVTIQLEYFIEAERKMEKEHKDAKK